MATEPPVPNTDDLVAARHPIYEEARSGYNIESEEGLPPEQATPEARSVLRNLVADIGREPYLQKLTVGRGIVTEWRGRGDSGAPVTEFSVVIWPTAEVFKLVIWALEGHDWVVKHEGDGLDYGELLDTVTKHLEGKL